MGNTIHVHIKHVIEYSDGHFNWQHEELANLLKKHGCEIYSRLDEDAVGEWEISEEQFKDAVAAIEKSPATEIRECFCDFRNDRGAEQFKEEVVNLLRIFERNGDHRDGFYHFSWF